MDNYRGLQVGGFCSAGKLTSVEKCVMCQEPTTALLDVAIPQKSLPILSVKTTQCFFYYRWHRRTAP